MRIPTTVTLSKHVLERLRSGYTLRIKDEKYYGISFSRYVEEVIEKGLGKPSSR